MTYDVYRSYVNPKATGAKLVRLSHFVVVAFAAFCACVAAGLSQTSIGVNFIVVSSTSALVFVDCNLNI